VRARIRHDLVTQLDYSSRMRRHAARGAFTLIELIVVLVIMALATALVAPALLRPLRDDGAHLVAIVASARETAAARGEIVYLRFDPSGDWHIEGGGSSLEGTVMHGRMHPLSRSPLTLIVAPTGSCAFDVASSAAAAAAVTLDPLSCDLRIISSS
jgi:prepilin-type N-terminal cleavage/methylation domain-containing protein